MAKRKPNYLQYNVALARAIAVTVLLNNTQIEENMKQCTPETRIFFSASHPFADYTKLECNSVSYLCRLRLPVHKLPKYYIRGF